MFILSNRIDPYVTCYWTSRQYVYVYICIFNVIYTHMILFCCLLFFRVAEYENCFISKVHHL